MNSNARIRAMTQLSVHLGIPVTIDTTGWLRHGVALRYRPGLHGVLYPTDVLVGRDAGVADVLEHRDLVDCCALYNRELGMARELWQRLDALVQHPRGPDRLPFLLKVLCVAVDDFDRLVVERQLARMGNGFATREVLAREVAFFAEFRVSYEPIVAGAEQVGRRQRHVVSS